MSGPPLQVLDVRERSEWERGHIPGAVHVPYHDIDALPAGHRPRGAGGGDLRLGPARGGRRQPAAPATARARSSTWSTAASPAWGREGWPLEAAG